VWCVCVCVCVKACCVVLTRECGVIRVLVGQFLGERLLHREKESKCALRVATGALSYSSTQTEK